MRTRTHKQTKDMRSQVGELYDLVRDPDETENVFDDPEYSAVQSELIAYLHARPDDIGPNREPVGPA